MKDTLINIPVNYGELLEIYVSKQIAAIMKSGHVHLPINKKSFLENVPTNRIS